MSLPAELRSFFDIFEDLEDPRVERTKQHPLPEILLATVCGVIAGCDGWSDIESFCRERLDYLRQYQPFENGAPSDDTYRRVFRALDPDQFQRLFSQWVGEWFQASAVDATIAIDGKTLRGSADGAQKALHLVSAFASEARIVLGQRRVSEKSNEITAIPALIDALDLRGATVSIDAMGCQHKIAKLIHEKGTHFVFGLKGNQQTLHEDVVQWFEGASESSSACVASVEKGHGRIEERCIRISDDTEWLRARHPKWSHLNSIIEVSSTRHIGEQSSHERRYYVSSLPANAERAASAIRSHWGIENTLHWTLDMSFGEDQSRIRKGNAVQNMAVIRHAVLNAIQAVKPKRQSVKQMRKRAGWSQSVLDSVLKQLI